MSLISRFTGRKRVRLAAKALGADPSADNYIALAREHVFAGEMKDVLRVCREGLEVHPHNPELTRIAARARQIHLDGRLRGLSRELQISPRPALYKELCQLQLEADRALNALEAASSWFESTQDPEALFFQARARVDLFFESRRSEDGREAYALTEKASDAMRGDPRPLELMFEMMGRIGAWHEARKAVARLLEVRPGDPDLEQRFRTVLASCHDAMSFDRALLEVERTGRFLDDRPEGVEAPASVAVRPALQELGSDPDVEAVVYLRGGTALVQGPQGATAERTARCVREVAQKSRDAARRLALGNVLEVQMEGDEGAFRLVPGKQGISAIWSRAKIKPTWVETLAALVGAGGTT